MDTADLKFTGRAACIVTFEDKGPGYAGAARFTVVETAEGGTGQKVNLRVETERLISCRGSFVVVLENGLWNRFKLTESHQWTGGVSFSGLAVDSWTDGTGCGS